MEEFKFKDLVIPNVDKTNDELLEMARKDVPLDRAAFEKLLEDGKLFSIVENGITDMIVGNQEPGYLEDWKGTLLRNQGKIMAEHPELFLYYLVFVHAAYSLFRKIKNELNGKSVGTGDTILVTFLGILCRMADDIGVLLTHGSTKAALALWRSFYEHAVIGIFLMQEKDEDLYKKFADHSYKDVKKKTDSFNKQRETLKFPPLTEEHTRNIEARATELKEKYGPSFFGEYAWAKEHLAERPTFWAVEQKANMGRYRPFYIWVSNYTHPNFQALGDFLDGNGKLILDKVTEPSFEKQSFVDPMQLTLSVFHAYLGHFLDKYSVDHQYDVNMLMFRKIYDKMAGFL